MILSGDYILEDHCVIENHSGMLLILYTMTVQGCDVSLIFVVVMKIHLIDRRYTIKLVGNFWDQNFQKLTIQNIFYFGCPEKSYCVTCHIVGDIGGNYIW